jgi:hypothetical protein
LAIVQSYLAHCGAGAVAQSDAGATNGALLAGRDYPGDYHVYLISINARGCYRRSPQVLGVLLRV